jgi:hypothetical protein
LVLAGVLYQLTAPSAQAASTRYTFTRIAERGFMQYVEGQGIQPQYIASSRPAINDDGVVAFGHAAAFPFNRSVVSASDGTAIRQVHGGGVAAPRSDPGIDGSGMVYVFTSPPDPLCPATTSHCIVREDGTIIVSATPTSIPVGFLVNGAHERLRPAGSAQLAYFVDTPGGHEYHTDAGAIAAPGGQFSSIVGWDYDMNASGEVVFMAQTPEGFGIFARRTGEAVRTVFLNYNNPSGVGFVTINGLRIDDSGAVYFSGSSVGEQQTKLYRIDPGSQDPVVLVDGNAGPLVLHSSISVAVNGSGSLAFMATRGVGGTAGIYTGPDPVAHKVIEVGDVVDGRTVTELLMYERAINNNGVDGLGQIVFSVRFDNDEGYSLYRANPPGSTPDNPVLPLQKAAGVKAYKFARKKMACAGGTLSYWDPPFAIGYEYMLEPGDPLFQSVILPSFPTHNSYELQLWDGSGWVPAATLSGETEHAFPAGGVDRFRITGIPEALGLDLEDPQAFVTGLRFIHTPGKDSVGLSMTVLTADAPATINWPAPSPIVYGTPLGANQLNATSTATGTFSYSPAPGTVLHAGTRTLTVSFTPDAPDAGVVNATVMLPVLQAPLTISADDKVMRAGEPLPALTATYLGLVNGDTPASLDVPPLLTTNATGASAGEFPIVVTGADDPDYSIEHVPGVLTVRNTLTRCWGEPDRTALLPLNADGSSVFRKGSSVIVRFRACDGRGVPISARSLISSFQLVQSQAGTVVSHVNELPLYLPPTPSFVWDPWFREWISVLSTRGLTAKRTYTYRVGLSDGTAIDLRFGVR